MNGLEMTYAYSLEMRMNADSVNNASNRNAQQKRKAIFETVYTRGKGDERHCSTPADEHVPKPNQTLQK